MLVAKLDYMHIVLLYKIYLNSKNMYVCLVGLVPQ